MLAQMNGVERLARATYRMARRIVVTVVGSTLVLLGVILIFTPGPAFVVLPLGLAVLAIEFAFARRWLKRVRAMVSRPPAQAAAAGAPGRGNGQDPSEPSPPGYDEARPSLRE